MASRSDIIRLLSDGRFHSGTELGRVLGVSRAAVCKAVKHVATSGLAVHRVPGRGYRLPAALSLLQEQSIRQALGQDSAPWRSFQIFDEIESTNAHLLAASRSGADIIGTVCLAEMQKTGRGRRGRQWVGTPFQNILMSIGWRFDDGPAGLAGLSLAAGVAVAEALITLGVTDVNLKWPNDVLWRGKKLGGLLIEMQGEAAGPTIIVLGVGINVRIGAADAALIDQPWTDMSTILGQAPDRNVVAATVLRHLANVLSGFAAYDVSGIRERWQRLDAFRGKSVRVVIGENVHQGVVVGIDKDGALIVENKEGRRTFHAGEISLRGS